MVNMIYHNPGRGERVARAQRHGADHRAWPVYGRRAVDARADGVAGSLRKRDYGQSRAVSRVCRAQYRDCHGAGARSSATLRAAIAKEALETGASVYEVAQARGALSKEQLKELLASGCGAAAAGGVLLVAGAGLLLGLGAGVELAAYGLGELLNLLAGRLEALKHLARHFQTGLEVGGDRRAGA